MFMDELALPLCGARDAVHLRTTLTVLQDEAARYVGAAHADSVLGTVRAAVLIRSRSARSAIRPGITNGATNRIGVTPRQRDHHSSGV